MRRNREEKNALKNCYSIHTFELKIRIDREDLQGYKDILNDSFIYNRQSTGKANRRLYKEIEKKHIKPTMLSEFECYDNTDLFNQGVSDICLEENMIVFPDSSRNTVSNFISMRVNPRRLLGYLIYPYIRVVPSEDINEILPKLIAVLAPYGFMENDIRQAMISRLDVCVNIKLDSQDLAEKYLYCLRKGGDYLGLREKYMERSETTHRKEFPKNEMRYVGAVSNNKGDCQEMSFYLKKSQMLESGKPYSPDEIHMADGQIRMEFRLFRSKIRYFENKYGCKGSCGILSSVGIIGEEIMTKYLHGLYGKGKMLKTRIALNRISRSHHKKCIKQMMFEIIEETRKADMAEAFGDMPSYKKSHLMRLFNELDISPITIPDSWCFERFENPVTYIRTRNVNERDLE